MMDLYCETDGIFPSVYQFYDSAGKPALKTQNAECVYSNVAEAVRVAKEVPGKCVSSPPATLLVVYRHILTDCL